MKQEYAEQVATRIIEQLEQGVAPWQKPWQPGELRLPYNPTTGKEYRGMNAIWLHMQDRTDPRWMTYNQAAAMGAQIRKGEKGSCIVYWKFTDEIKATDDQGRPILDESGKQKTINVKLERPRSFSAVVFNAEQIDGLPPLVGREPRPDIERHAQAEIILANSGASILHKVGDRAFYRLSTDSITLPERNQFNSADRYYATALHELGHWTGHQSRLDRDISHPFGSESYAREELRAEIASLMLGERLDIGHDPGQHAAYVGSWIKALKEDPREIFRAAADAERITAYIMQFEQERVIQLSSDKPSVIAETLQPLAPTDDAVLHEPPQNPHASRTYLAVPYLERLQAKTHGAKWDKTAKSWYVPDGIEMVGSGLARWCVEGSNTFLTKTPDLLEAQFLQALKSAGLCVDAAKDGKVHPIADGKIHKLPTIDDDTDQLSGVYAFQININAPSGFIRNYKTDEVVYWKPEGKVAELAAKDCDQLIAEAGQQLARRQSLEVVEYACTSAVAAPSSQITHSVAKQASTGVLKARVEEFEI